VSISYSVLFKVIAQFKLKHHMQANEHYKLVDLYKTQCIKMIINT